MAKVFIDGSAGTTGLRIRDRLAERKDLTLLSLPEDMRKNAEARRQMLHEADIAFLCLPDAAAKEAVTLAEGSDVAVIDTSTAHRTAPGWVYGFPEFTGYREAIKQSKRIANPGCHATGFLSLIRPLTEVGLLGTDAALTCFSLTGYSGGGKKMIAEYTSDARSELFDAPRQYGLTQMHKHLPEMQKIGGLCAPPVFCPVVADYYSGMEVTVPLPSSLVRGSKEDIASVYQAYYSNAAGLIRFCASTEDDPEGGFLSAVALSGRDDLEIRVCGDRERILLVARFDNLGKGASGAAIQNMNLLLGLPEDTGLNVKHSF